MAEFPAIAHRTTPLRSSGIVSDVGYPSEEPGSAGPATSLLGLHAVEEDVLDVFFVLADVLDDVRVGQQDEGDGH